MMCNRFIGKSWHNIIIATYHWMSNKEKWNWLIMTLNIFNVIDNIIYITIHCVNYHTITFTPTMPNYKKRVLAWERIKFVTTCIKPLQRQSQIYEQASPREYLGVCTKHKTIVLTGTRGSLKFYLRMRLFTWYVLLPSCGYFQVISCTVIVLK